MDIKEKRKWQAFLIRYVMEFGSEAVDVQMLIGNEWYQSKVNRAMTINPSLAPAGMSYWVDGVRGNPIELGPLAFELIAANLTPKPRRRKITDNSKKGDLC